MALNIGDKTYRTIQEQVAKNQSDIKDINNYLDEPIKNVQIVNGHLIVTTARDVEIDAGELLAITSIYMENSHLKVDLNDGTTQDLGLVKSLTSFSIDGSQHLIVTYSDGTTQDLGAIFSGNVNIAGNLTADSIIENMTGYGYVSPGTISGITIEPVYAGVVKTGNKITFVISANLTKTGSPNAYISIGSFTMPQTILDKLVPAQIGLFDFLDVRRITIAETYVSMKNVGTIVKKVYPGIVFEIATGDMTLNVKYYARYEVTFLLSDNLAA